jgi:hypothetical protein
MFVAVVLVLSHVACVVVGGLIVHNNQKKSADLIAAAKVDAAVAKAEIDQVTK